MADPQDPKDPNADPNKDPKGDEPKVYKTQEEFDQAFSARLERERKKLEKDLDEKLKKQQTEAERLAKLSEDEKAKEQRRAQEEADAKRERDLTLREMRLEAADQLEEKGMPRTLVDLVVDVDADQVSSNIENLSKAFNKAVEDKVQEKLKGKTPNDPSGNGKKNDADGKRSGTVVL